MTEIVELLEESAEQLLRRHCSPELVAGAEADGWSESLWRELVRADLTRVGLPEELGGAGGGLAEAAAVVKMAARFAAPVPIAETCLMGGWLLAEAGIQLPDGPLSAGVLESGAARVPYGRFAESLALLDEASGELLVLGPGQFDMEPGVSLAGEPRDLVRPRPGLGSRHQAPAAASATGFRARAALARAVQIAGTLERIAELSVEYAGERQQFGSPLNRFQAVQEMLAGVAGEAAAAGAAVNAAVAEPSPYRIAAAKSRASEAAGAGARWAHQVHGAIGFTHEHPLHLYTRRLWSWREDYGNEAEWGRVLGEIILAAGADGLWPGLTASAVDLSHSRK